LLTAENVKYFITKSLGIEVQAIMEIHEIRDRSGREILDCMYSTNAGIKRHILKAYHKGFDDDAELGVANVARKTHLSSIELAAHSIRIPRVFGSHLSDEIACVVMEYLEPEDWRGGTREEAAGILACLHNLPIHILSDDLQKLIHDSKPNRDRGRLGVIGRSKFLDKMHPEWREQNQKLSGNVSEIVESVEPVSSMTTLVHGDYFSVNLIPTSDGLHVIDWDLLALGDPMWDLGFLIGADSGIDPKEIEDVVDAYRRNRPVDEDVLKWQMTCWESLLGLMKLGREYRAKQDSPK